MRITEGTGLEDRHRALITALLDTGARLSEIANPRAGNIDWDLAVAVVVGKGRRHRSLPLGPTTLQGSTAT